GLIIRYDFSPERIEPRFLNSVWSYMPINIILTVMIFYIFRMYHSLWRYAGIVEMQNAFSSCILASMVQLAGLLILDLPVPRSYYFLYGGVLLLLTIGSRFAYRYLRSIFRKKVEGDMGDG